MDHIEGLAAALKAGEISPSEAEVVLDRAQEIFDQEKDRQALNPRTHSMHCWVWLGLRARLQVCRSAAGYYIGVVFSEALGLEYPDRDFLPGEPLSRDSQEYFKSELEAQLALGAGDWTQRANP